MAFEGIIATPFGYLMDGIYRLTSHYGITIILFAIVVQAAMFPLSLLNKKNAQKKYRLQPMVAKLNKEFQNDANARIDAIDALYKKEHYSIVGTFILQIVPIFILMPLFQVMAQPITYLFHESPETSAAIVKAIYDEAPHLFVSSYKQVTAISHIAEYADVVKMAVPEVSARTLEGLDYSMFGLNLGSVAGAHVLGKSNWAWDWAHIGVIMFPIIYMSRRIYKLIYGVVVSFKRYKAAKKHAEENDLLPPSPPKPPLVQLFFLALSLTAMFSIPIAMNLYWLTGGVADSAMRKAANKIEAAKAAAVPTPAQTEADAP